MKAAWVPLALGVLGLSGVAYAQPHIRTYVVQPGDSVWSIAEEFYGSGQKYPLIYKHNDFIGKKPPFLLKVGQELKLPLENQRPEAQVSWLQREVRAKPPRSADWLNAREQMSLWRLYRVSTGDESAARIVFDDASDLKLRENALLVIYGASATTAKTARRDKREVMLEQGTISGGLAALDGEAGGLKVKTASAEVDILGPSTQVQTSSLETLVSVFQGYAAVTSQGATVSVPEGQGTRVEKGKRPEAPRPLPQAPDWSEGANNALVASVQGQAVTWEARWQSIANAKGYRVELAADPSFSEVLYDVEVDASVQRVRLAELKPGQYYVRLATRDGVGLESVPSKPLQIRVVPVRSNRTIQFGDKATVDAFGLAALSLGEDTEPDVHFRFQGRDQRDLYITQPGTHLVELVQGESKSTFTVQVGQVFGELKQRQDDDGAWLLEAFVKDAQGQLKALPGLEIELSDASGEQTSLPLEARQAGHYVARYVPSVEGAAWAARLSWPGGELGRVQEEAVRVEVALPAGYREPTLIHPKALVRGAMVPHASYLLETKVGLDVALPYAARTTEDELELGLGVFGALRLGAIELNAQVGFAHLRLGSDEPEARMNEASLGARVALAEGRGEGLSVGLALTAPLGNGHSQPLTLPEELSTRVYGAELQLSGRKRLGDDFFIDARVGVLAGSDFDESSLLNLGALVGIGWQPVESWWFNLTGELVAGLERELWTQMYGVGTGLVWGGSRLGLGFGFTVDEQSERHLGRYFGRLTWDISLGAGR